jgi:S-adenosylmethionine synthetase
MFGYACNETPDLIPAPIFYAHKILRLISEARHSGREKVLGPDSKSQVTVQYENGKPVGVREIVVSHQHLVMAAAHSPPDLRAHRVGWASLTP